MGAPFSNFAKVRRQASGEQDPYWLIRDLPDKRTVWAEVERLHLPINPVDSRRSVTFRALCTGPGFYQ
jgi:hypothetical protein